MQLQYWLPSNADPLDILETIVFIDKNITDHSHAEACDDSIGDHQGQNVWREGRDKKAKRADKASSHANYRR